MSEKMRESMSALMDGETTDFETRRLLEGMDTPELRDTWARYHLASAAMKRDAAAVLPQIDISAAVSQAIAKEDALAEPHHVDLRHSRPMKTVAGFATAATIAFAAVIGVQSFNTEDERMVPSIAASAVPPSSSRVGSLALAADTVRGNAARFVPPISAPSATLVSNAAFPRTQSGIQPVALSSNTAFMNDGTHQELPAASQLAAQRQLETYLARHAELAGSWRAATADETSAHPDDSRGSQWQARWLPSGYRLVAINNDVASDSTTPVLTSVYSNGLSAFSVFVSTAHDEPAMDMRRGATIACSRRIQASGNAYTATVVGEIPQLSAERVATSVYQLPSN
jgi:sigma-E factor negative regulatory protein RseA